MNEYDLTPESVDETLSVLCSSINSTIAALTSIPQHPYDIAKAILLSDDYIATPIEDVNVPENVNLDTIIKGLEYQYNSYQDRVLEYLSAPDEYNLSQSGNQLTALAELSGAKNYVVTPEKYKMYIETIEIIKGININSITAENCNDIIQKIGYTVLQTFNKKTVTV